MRTLALPKAAEPWSLTSLREKLIKIGAKVIRNGRYVVFQMAEVAVSRQMFRNILGLIDGSKPRYDRYRTNDFSIFGRKAGLAVVPKVDI